MPPTPTSLIKALYTFTRPTPTMDCPGGSESKASTYKAEDLDSVSGSGRSPGEGNGNPLQYSCLENPMVGKSHGWRIPWEKIPW